MPALKTVPLVKLARLSGCRPNGLHQLGRLLRAADDNGLPGPLGVPSALQVVQLVVVYLDFHKQVDAPAADEQVGHALADCMQVLDAAAHAAQRCHDLRLVAVNSGCGHAVSDYCPRVFGYKNISFLSLNIFRSSFVSFLLAPKT